MAKDPTQVEIDGRRLVRRNLDKVLYPGSGTTKGEVINYYATIAPTLLPHLGTRPITRKRWPDGTAVALVLPEGPGGLGAGAGCPRWRCSTRTGRSATRPPTRRRCWSGSPSSPRWNSMCRNGSSVPDGAPTNPDRVVFDLDPGPGATLAQCAEVAFAVKDHLDAAELVSVPVTSGSKGLHLYARVDGTRSSEEISRGRTRSPAPSSGGCRNWRCRR